jgi:hypothetical protein
LSTDHSDWRGGDFDAATGRIHLVGDLTLDMVKVQCIADIDLSTLQGRGHLRPIDDVRA